MNCTRFAAIASLAVLPFFGCSNDALATDSGGPTLYQSVCKACHGPENVMVSAPKAGDVDEWRKRLAKAGNRLETLTDHAVNGFGAMPANGGSGELPRDQIRQVIEFMMTFGNVTDAPASR